MLSQEYQCIIQYCFHCSQILNVLSLQIVIKLDNYPFLDYTLWNTRNNNLSLFICLFLYLLVVGLYVLLGLFITLYRQSGVDFITFILSPCKAKKRIIKVNEKEELNDKIELNHQDITEINQKKKDSKDCLSIRRVTRYYGDLAAVNNFTGEIYGGEIFCLLGHNGAGKTTLIRMISGIEDPDKGDIF